MGGAVFLPCCLTWDPTMVKVMRKMATSFKISHAHTSALSVPDRAAGHRWPTSPLETPGHSQASLGQSLVGSLLLYPGSWFTQNLIMPFKGLFPSPVLAVLCGINGDLLQGGLRHTQVCCTQIPCPWGRPLMTCTSIGDIQTLKGRSGSVSVSQTCHHLEPDILEYEVKWAIRSIIWTKLVEVMEFLMSCFKS